MHRIEWVRPQILSNNDDVDLWDGVLPPRVCIWIRVFHILYSTITTYVGTRLNDINWMDVTLLLAIICIHIRYISSYIVSNINVYTTCIMQIKVIVCVHTKLMYYSGSTFSRLLTITTHCILFNDIFTDGPLVAARSNACIYEWKESCSSGHTRGVHIKVNLYPLLIV